jgi:Fic family protein
MKKQRVPNKPLNTLPKLPPDSEKIELISVLKQESRARSALAELKGLSNIIPNQAILINTMIIQEAKDSSEIENIITTRDKLYKSIATKETKNDSQTFEVLLHTEALYHGYDKIKEQSIIRNNDVDNLQSILIGNNAGRRKTSGTKLMNDKTGEVVFTPPEPKFIPKLMDNFIDYFNTCDDTLINLAILHFQFESIHPYYDGNGRTGRLLNILYLLNKDFINSPIIHLSSYLTRTKKEYYKYLNEVTLEDKWENWLIYILKGIETVSIETIQVIKNIDNLLSQYIQKVKDEKPKIYSKELVETLFENPYCKIDFIVRKLNIERKAASRYLAQLCDIGLLEKSKIGKENIYINIQLMDLLRGNFD